MTCQREPEVPRRHGRVRRRHGGILARPSITCAVRTRRPVTPAMTWLMLTETRFRLGSIRWRGRGSRARSVVRRDLYRGLGGGYQRWGQGTRARSVVQRGLFGLTQHRSQPYAQRVFHDHVGVGRHDRHEVGDQVRRRGGGSCPPPPRGPARGRRSDPAMPPPAHGDRVRSGQRRIRAGPHGAAAVADRTCRASSSVSVTQAPRRSVGDRSDCAWSSAACRSWISETPLCRAGFRRHSHR